METKLVNKLKLFLIIASLAGFFAACSGSSTPATNAPATDNKAVISTPAAPPPTQTPVDEVAMGRDLYTTHCMTCHKDSGKGGPTTVDGKKIEPDDITTTKQKAKSDEKLYGYVAEGFPEDGMPSFKDKLKAEQIKMIIKHVRTLQK